MIKFIRKSIFLSVFCFSLVFSTVQGAEENLVPQSPIRLKQEVVYRTPEKSNSSISISTPLRLEMANMEVSKLKATIANLLGVITDDRFVRPAFAHLFRAIVEGQNEHTIGNLLRKVEEVRDPPTLELPVDFDKKIRRRVTESAIYLMNNELTIQNGIRTNFPTINYITFKPFRTITTREITYLVNSLRGLSVGNNVGDQIIPRFDALKQLVSKSLEEPVVDIQQEIDLGALPKLEVHEYQNFTIHHPGIYEWYVVGSAIPDGNCFFHATLTQNGQDEIVVRQNASHIRTSIVAEIIRNEDDQRLIRLEMLGFYREMFFKQELALIPEIIQNMLYDNDEYTIARNNYLRINEDINQLPIRYRNNVRHSDDYILNAIVLEHIQTYLEKYLNDQNDEYYIEVPVVRDTHAGISEIIARKNNIVVNYFTLNQERGALNYAGTLGNNGTTIHNLLIHGRHFYPLYNDAEGIDKKDHFVQSLNNFVEFMYNTYFPNQLKNMKQEAQ